MKRAQRKRAANASGWLYYGPCLGEFGHELAATPVLRRNAKSFERVTVCSRPGREALYDGICDEFIAHNIVCEGDYNGVAQYETVHPSEIDRWRSKVADSVCGQIGVYGTSHKAYRAMSDFVKLGEVRAEYKGAVVIHARSRPHVKQRNWPIRLWNRLARRLYRIGISRILCVGTTKAALMVDGACDLRARGLREQMNALRSARLCIGPSSGPMHLAQSCGCPVVVWCGGGPGERTTTRARYVRDWNPFRVPHDAFLKAGWRPAYNVVERRTLAMLERLDAMNWEHP